MRSLWLEALHGCRRLPPVPSLCIQKGFHPRAGLLRRRWRCTAPRGGLCHNYFALLLSAGKPSDPQRVSAGRLRRVSEVTVTRLALRAARYTLWGDDSADRWQCIAPRGVGGGEWLGADHKPPGQSDRHPACSGDIVVNPGLKSDRDRRRCPTALQGKVAGADQMAHRAVVDPNR
jgi:hypothetical protein